MSRDTLANTLSHFVTRARTSSKIKYWMARCRVHTWSDFQALLPTFFESSIRFFSRFSFLLIRLLSSARTRWDRISLFRSCFSVEGFYNVDKQFWSLQYNRVDLWTKKEFMGLKSYSITGLICEPVLPSTKNHYEYSLRKMLKLVLYGFELILNRISFLGLWN